MLVFFCFSLLQMTRLQIGYMRAPPGRSDVRTPNIRRSSWRRSSSLTCTSRGTGGTRWRARSTWRSGRSRSGSRTVGWKWRNRARTNQRTSTQPTISLSLVLPLIHTHAQTTHTHAHTHAQGRHCGSECWRFPLTILINGITDQRQKKGHRCVGKGCLLTEPCTHLRLHSGWWVQPQRLAALPPKSSLI